MGVTSLGGVTAGAVLWRMDGTLRATIVVKAVFRLVAEQPMWLTETEPLVRAEVNFGRHPARSVERTIEMAPYLPQTDVVLTGHACAPAGTKVPSLVTRLGVYGHSPLLDKIVQVVGDDDGKVPFDRMPLMYERAYGGLGAADNPFGTGVDAGMKSPNLIHPEDAKRVACYAPIGRTWPARKRLLAGLDRKILDAPIAEIPSRFDFAYYQAAPLDQRIPYLTGNEWIVLEGMHPTLVSLRSRLPTARVVGCVYGPDKPEEGEAVAFVADCLRIEADHLRCSVIWRGTIFPTGDPSALTCVVGIETEQQTLVWPSKDELAAHWGVGEIEELELDEGELVDLDNTMTNPKGRTGVPKKTKPKIADERTVEVDLKSILGSPALPFAEDLRSPKTDDVSPAAKDATPWATSSGATPHEVPSPVGWETVEISASAFLAESSAPVDSGAIAPVAGQPMPAEVIAREVPAVPPAPTEPFRATPERGVALQWRTDASPIESAAPAPTPEKPRPKAAVPPSFPKLQNNLYGRFRKP